MKNVLVLCDSFWHPAEVVQMGLSPLEGDEFHLVFIKDAKDILTPERIAGYPLIICAKGDNISEANTNPWFDEGVAEVGPAEIREYIAAGGGYIALHAGTIGKKGTPYGDLIGSTFLGHPPRCAVGVKITGTHPVTEGVVDFRIRDEHYQMAVETEDMTELFRTVSESGGEQLAGYAREIGDGRMCVLTPGHCLDVFLHPGFQAILRNAMRWCMRKG